MQPSAPDAALRLVPRGDHAVPDWLGPQDHGWLRELVAEHERFVGRPRRELVARLREPFSSYAPRHKRLLACSVLGRLLRGRAASRIPARFARERAALAKGRLAVRAEALAAAAAELEATPEEVEAALLADLPDERHVELKEAVPDLQELAARCNLLYAQALLHRALAVTVTLEGGSRAVIRQAHWKGLLCACDDAARITISGPLALHRHTTLYGRALAELAAFLPWTARFTCEVRCVVRGSEHRVVLASGDPIRPGTMPRTFDSRLEERFATDFAKLAPEWHVLREPAPLRATSGWAFPDFLLRHRTIPEREWYVEIVGFWTPEYLRTKLAAFRELALPRLVLCLDATRRCSPGEIPTGAFVVPFERRIDAGAVLRSIT